MMDKDNLIVLLIFPRQCGLLCIEICYQFIFLNELVYGGLIVML